MLSFEWHRSHSLLSCLPFQSGLFPHPLSGRYLEQSLHAQHVQPEIAGQDTRAVAALMVAQGEKKGRCLGIRVEGPLVCKGEPDAGEAQGLWMD